jgi:hypothetical protein
MIAIHFNNFAIAEFSVDNGADVCYALPDSGLTALHKCASLAATRQNSDAMMGHFSSKPQTRTKHAGSGDLRSTTY